jgi:hypothetical protein
VSTKRAQVMDTIRMTESPPPKKDAMRLDLNGNVHVNGSIGSDRLDFDSLVSGIDTVSIPESLGIDSYRYRIDSS